MNEPAKNTADTSELTEMILGVLQDVAPDIDRNTLDPDRHFRDQAEMDSVDFLNFVLGLEKKLKIRVRELDYPKLASLNSCLAYLTQANDG